MHFGTWLKRVLIICLLIASFCVVVFGSRVENKQSSQVVQSKNDEWNPANITLSSKSTIEDKIQNSPSSLATKAPVSQKSSETPATTPSSPSEDKKSKNTPTKEQKQVTQERQTSGASEKKARVKRKNRPSQTASQTNAVAYKTTAAFKKYKPKHAVIIADPSNYGDRYRADINGNPANNPPIAVLHETSNSAMSAINTFRTAHSDDSKQVSYHSLVAMDGTIVYLVPPDKRAFGAGNSVFEGPWGVETVKTNSTLPPSVNNFAYHVSLETPPDGRGKYHDKYHSGYTERQYKSLAWLLAQSSIPDSRITTHKDVDRSGQRIDPRSFDFKKFFNILHSYRQPLR